MNLAIVDDEQLEIDHLLPIISEYAGLENSDIPVQVFHSAEELLTVYRPYAFTAIFMDIYMTGITGVEAGRRILAMDPGAVIIFFTTSQDHMGDAFSIHAYDYIPKPAEKERIFKVLNDLVRRETKLDSAPRLSFTCDKRNVSIPVSEITCIRTARHNYLDISRKDGSIFTSRLTLSEVQQRLEEAGAPQFLLVLRGVLVNMDFIKNMDDETCQLKDGMIIPINIKNARKLRDIWQNYTLDSIRSGQRERRNVK